MILAITPGDGRDPTPWLRALVDVGLRYALLREPQLDQAEYRALAERLAFVPGLILHSRCQGAFPTARALLRGLHHQAGTRPIGLPLEGVSCHDAAQVDAAFAAGATYALLSPIWSPLSKQDGRPTLGLQGYRAIAGDRRVLALGGVTPERLPELPHAALCGALFDRTPEEAAAALAPSLRRVAGAPGPR